MITNEQISALRWIIFHSKDGNELTKRIMVFLIDSSERLTKEVYISLAPDREGYNTSEIIIASHNIHNMNSDNCSTHINTILRAMGSEFRFESLNGEPGVVYDSKNRSFKGFSFFLMRNNSRQPMRLDVAREILDNKSLLGKMKKIV